MNNQNIGKKPIGKIVLGLIGIFIVIGIIAAVGGSDEPQGSSKQENFVQLANQRFSGIVEANKPQLDRIECAGGTCGEMRMYWNTLPEDLETILRGNAATFSKFRIDNLGTSNVIVFAIHEGKETAFCRAAKGRVEECKPFDR